MKKVLLSGLILIITVNIALAGGVGTTGYNYLRIGMGAKAVGMGEAQVALADNVDAIYWNPAGLVEVKRDEVGFMHLFYWQGISYDYLGYVMPVKGLGTLGIAATYLNSGTIDKTVENSTGTDFDKLTTFSYTGFSGILSYSNKIKMDLNALNYGLNIKMIGDNIDDSTVIGLAADIGAIYMIKKSISFGLNISNLGTVFSQSIPLPLTIKAGIGLKFNMGEKNYLNFEADGVYPLEAGIKANIGAEYTYDNIIFIRGGYKVNYDLETFTAGAGFRIVVDKNTYELNYAFAPASNDMGSTHRISLIARFGAEVKTSDLIE